MAANGLRFEGGLHAPCVVEWPAGIPKARRTSFPAVIDNDHKLLKGEKGNSGYQLYNLAKDPGESQNLIRTHRDVAAALTAKLEASNLSLDQLPGKHHTRSHHYPLLDDFP